MNVFETFTTFEDFINSLGQFRMEMGLERMYKGLALLGLNPESLPAVQVVGTNGKGSTACFLEILARFHGLKTGLYTSPHFVSVKERIRVNNEDLSHDIWLDAANEVFACCRGLNLTYFEFLTLMAAFIFHREKVDLAVIEAGLGGRYDATSIIYPLVNVFTLVGLDHTHILGGTLEEIAMDKSMAMKKGPVVVAEQPPAVMNVLMNRAREIGASVNLVRDNFEFAGDNLRFMISPEMVVKSSEIGLKGFYQLSNAATSLLCWRVLAQKMKKRFDPNLCALALKRAFWPGRMHFVQNNPRLILDGAHNSQAMRSLALALRKMNIRPETIIFSCLKDKDVKEMIDIILSLNARNVFVPDIKANPRAMSRQELACLSGPTASPLPDLKGYLAQVKKEEAPVLVCGSLYLLADIYAAFPHWLKR